MRGSALSPVSPPPGAGVSAQPPPQTPPFFPSSAPPTLPGLLPLVPAGLHSHRCDFSSRPSFSTSPPPPARAIRVSVCLSVLLRACLLVWSGCSPDLSCRHHCLKGKGALGEGCSVVFLPLPGSLRTCTPPPASDERLPDPKHPRRPPLAPCGFRAF